jgi:uncharacterized delta-60 repeat protein
MFRSQGTKWFDRPRPVPHSRRRTTRPTVEALEERTLLTAGALDPTFGLNGVVATDINGLASARAVAVEPNGQIVVAGFARDPATGSRDFALARYNSDGTLDTSFGSGGVVLTDFRPLLGPGDAEADALAVQGDG